MAVPVEQQLPEETDGANRPVSTRPHEPAARTRGSSRRLLEIGLLLAVLLVSFGLRSWNLNWDSGQHQHPDERFWSDVANRLEELDRNQYPDGYLFADPATSHSNPYNVNQTYVYGTSPMAITKTLAGAMQGSEGQGNILVDALDGVGLELKNADDRVIFNNRYDVNIFGRLLSAIIDTLSVALVFALGRELGGRTVGLVGAGLAAFSVMNIQYAHFFGAEPWVTFLSTAAVLGSVRLAKGSTNWSTRLLTGLVLGFAIATKLSGVAVFVAPLIAVLIAALAPAATAAARRWRLLDQLSIFIVMTLVALLTFRIAQPFVFEGALGGLSLRFNQQFIADIDYLSGVNAGGNVPWVVQWVNRSPLLYPVSQVFWWGMGPGLALASLAGLAFGVRDAVRRQRWYLLVPTGFVLAFLVLVSRQFNALDRYLLPAYPTAIALAGYAIVRLWKSSAPRLAWLPTNVFAFWRPMVRIAIGLAVVTTVLWGAAFTNGVYGTKHSRVIASEWMVENLPEGAVVTSQLWDDALPLYAPSVGPHSISTRPLDPFGGESREKITGMIQVLDEVDYVVEASNRLYGSIPRMPARWPVTRQYYKALYDGTLGFEIIAEFQTPPSLFGVTIDDRNAEETFTVYDHPKVTIWQKTAAWSPDAAAARLQPDRAAAAVDHIPSEGARNGLQLAPDDYIAQQAGGTYSDIFDSDGFTSKVPWLWWLLWLQVAAFATLPFTLWLFGRLPDRGYGLSKIMGLMAVGVPIWLLVSTGLVNYGAALIWAVLAVLVFCGVAFAYLRPGLGGALREGWKSWLASELVFLGIFAAVLAIRYANPDVWFQWRGGEKPMELAYFTAIARSTTFPAYDPWFAGGYLNYYYVGWYFLSLPTRALRMAPDIAFNLGIATFAALAAVTVFSVVRNMAGLAQPSGETRTGKGTTRAGLLGVVLFMVIGNYDAVRLHVSQLREAARNEGNEGGAISETLSGMWFWVTGGDLPRFDWWAPSRANKGLYSDGGAILDITEFPSWTILFGDLHPHFMGMPFFGLMVATALAFVVSSKGEYRRRSWWLAGLLGVVLGVVRMVHTWDWPTVLILGFGAIATGQILAPDAVRQRLLRFVGQVVVFVAAYSVVAGAYNKANLADSGFQFLHGYTTNLDDFIAHWAPFLVIGCVYVVFRLLQLHQLRLWYMGLFGVPAALWLHLNVGSVAAWALAAVMFGGILTLVEGTARDVSIPHLASAGFLTLGFAIITGVEIVRLESDIDRFNTIFKFWLQVWQLFAIACAFGAWWIVRSLRTAALARRERDEGAALLRLARPVWIGSLALLLLLGMVFPLRATPARLLDRFDTNANNGLDGYAWLEPDRQIQTYESFVIDIGRDAGLIEWLRDNVEGSPTIVEAVGESYAWFGRASVNTGLPSVVGWNWHQRQQRTVYSGAVNQRWAAVEEFYSVPDPRVAERFLRTYDVSYVIVGAAEKAIARTEDGAIKGSKSQPSVLEMFKTMDVLTPVYDDGYAVIYEVDKPTLTERTTLELASN